MSSERHIRHMKTLLLALALLLAAEPVLARNIIDWRCGDQWVSLEVNKSTNPPTYDIIFSRMKAGGTLRLRPRFVWYPSRGEGPAHVNGTAYLNGKECYDCGVEKCGE
jgi:hypothetical protein